MLYASCSIVTQLPYQRRAGIRYPKVRTCHGLASAAYVLRSGEQHLTSSAAQTRANSKTCIKRMSSPSTIPRSPRPTEESELHPQRWPNGPRHPRQVAESSGAVESAFRRVSPTSKFLQVPSPTTRRGAERRFFKAGRQKALPFGVMVSNGSNGNACASSHIAVGDPLNPSQ